MRIKKGIKDQQNGGQARSGPCKGAVGGTSPPPGPALDAAANNNHDADFTHDNSDYQWFLDYNYRDGSCVHTSVLSSVSSSYRGLGSLACYEELARDLDANLAEADMESFRTRDIHALLSNLPPSACHLMQDTNRRGEMYASVTSSLMEKFCFDSSFSPHSSSQDEESTAGSINTMSICKSELLFSPVKESAAVPVHFSVDSLDCDRLEQDLILTCQANKHNYTIAFEGSMTMYSEDSDGQDLSNEKQDLPGEAKFSTSSETQEPSSQSTEKLQRSFRLSRPLDTSMAQSDSGFTTWSKLKNKTQLRRHPSGNNNTGVSSEGMPVTKSHSAPDLRALRRRCQCLTTSSSGYVMAASNVESYSAENRLTLPPGCSKAFNSTQNSHCINQSIASQLSEGMSSSGDSRGPNNNSRPHNFNLVKLFMKQKSMSNDGIVGSAMDQSSECWPNSSEGGDSGDSFSTDFKAKGKFPIKMNMSSDRDYQSDDCEVAQPESKTNAKKWVDNETNEYSSNNFEDSLVDGATNTEAYSKRTHDFIIEEDEVSEKSELVSQNDDKNIYATINKAPQMRFNINNNFERSGGITGSPIRVRGNATTQTKKSISSSINSISSCSESEGTQVTRMHKLLPRDPIDHKATSTQMSMDLMDKSMQTSCMSSFNISRDRLRVVEPSFLEKLKKGDSQKPVYVLYPNYTLPDLGFISKDQDMEKVFLKPLKFAPTADRNKKTKIGEKSKRPFSCNDVEGLRRKGFNHIRDWDSLTFLLPMEYRQILAEMPEIVQQLKEKEEEVLRHEERPLFCVSPPVRHKTRPVSCDCASLLSNNVTNISSSSSTATQPSSGYRGSSTMLTDSSAQNSPAPTATGFNPLFVYKYDSATSSEASFMNDKHRTGPMGVAPPLPKRSISLAEQNKMAVNGKVIDIAPPRPPLPKSILRKSIDKVRKSVPNPKRYSMIEMEDHAQDTITCMNAHVDQKNMKRRSLQEPYYLLKNNSIAEMKKNNDLAAKRFSQQFLDATEKDMDDTEFFHDEGVGTESSLDSGKSHDINMRPSTPPLPKPHSKNIVEVNPFVYPTSLAQPVISSADLQQLEEFLKHSGITCNDMEDWDNTHMQKVKNQVSRFLSMKLSQDGKESLDSSCSSGHSKKSVSFAEKNENKRSAESGLKLVEELKAGALTPPNSPNVPAGAIHRHYQAKNLAEIPICEEGESSPEGYASPALGHGLRRSSSNDNAQKRGLVSNVMEAVDMLVEEGSGCPRLVIGALCPALYALLSDGLRETIDTSFGPVNNSVWQVVEASARQGPITKSLNELVMRINSEDALSESVLKFNAFVMGLLNVRSLDAFISYLRTRESVLRRHYNAGAVIRGASAAALSTALAPLACMPFSLDLLWQLRDMHRSFKRMEDLMSNESSNSTSSTGHLSKNQRNLLRLVHSIQSSINQSSDDQPEPTPQVSVIMRNKSHLAEPSLPDLLDNSVNTKIQLNDKARPRSCVNPSMGNFSLVSGDGQNGSGNSSTYDQTRRWSGVQLGSKLIQAFDRLALYDDSDYSDSLEHDQKPKSDKREQQSDHLQDESNSSTEWSNEQRGGKFRQLQRRWEMLSGREGSPPPPGASSTGSTPGSTGSTPGSGRSRIPRPVTSPVRPPSAPIVPVSTVSPVKRSIPVAVSSAKKATTPPSTAAAGHKGPLPPLPHGHTGTRNATAANAKKTATNTNRVSRAEACGSGPAAPRPSSLPYRRAPPPSVTRQRRATSSSQPRPAGPAPQPPTKMVRTLWHRLPSDSGHLAFNEGERLRLVLEVDDQWLLCCRGQLKGLVPRSAVIPVPDSALQRF